jgi:hypothetical protein
VDALGNTEQARTLDVLRIDRTAPVVSGMPVQPCVIWPPNGRFVHVADVAAADEFSGIQRLSVVGSSDEPGGDDIHIADGAVDLRAFRDDESDGRVYTVTATATDLAGNVTNAVGTCVVPHDVRR